MNPTFAVASRLLFELRGDRRTLGLVVVVPAFIVFLFAEVFPSTTARQQAAPVLLSAFVFVLTYLLTAIGFLRERKSGTLERVLVSPIRRSQLVVGYVLGFGVLAVVQSAVLLGTGIVFLDVEFVHGVGPFFALELLGAFAGLGFGIVISLFAENEFQVQQLMPVVIGPQLILGNTFLPVEDLAWYLAYPAQVMPITHLVAGMEYVLLDAGDSADLWTAVGALAALTFLSMAAATVAVDRAM